MSAPIILRVVAIRSLKIKTQIDSEVIKGNLTIVFDIVYPVDKMKALYESKNIEVNNEPYEILSISKI